jgi:uncharacterized protein YrrD
MHWRGSGLIGTAVHGTDGSVGNITDLLFDDRYWTIRWVVVDAGGWIADRQVLLPPSQFRGADARGGAFDVELTREQIENCPGLGRDAPVSRQMERDIYHYYGWTPYWYHLAGAPAGIAPIPPPSGGTAMSADRGGPVREPQGDPDLRSMNEVIGYYVQATDDDIGHVEDFLIDDENWAIRYVVVDTRNWWPGKLVPVSPQWFSDVSWGKQRVLVDLTRDQVKNGPEYDPSAPIDRAYEERLHEHYGYRPYWV